MATFSTNTLTEKGTALMATALATAQSIEFTGLSIGDGAAPENPTALTDIVHKVMDVDISKVYIAPAEPGTSIFRASFQNKTGTAFRFREVGIYARLGGTSDSPILYGYANAGDTADLIDTVEEGSLLMQTLLCNIVTGSADVQLIDNPSAPLTRQDLLEYLPLTGGTMTGDILANKSALYIKQTVDNGELSLLGGVSSVSGGGFYAYGGENKSGAGWFRARAAKDGNYAELIGTPDGKLFWKGCDIITSAGGTINGAFTVSNMLLANCATTDTWLEINGGTSYLDGAYIVLAGKDSIEKGSGNFHLTASDGINVTSLRGKPTGELTWGSANVLTSVGGDLNGEIHHTKYGAPAIRYKDGGALFLFPMGQEFYKGGFILRAYSTQDTFVDLQGWSDGRLEWAGKEVIRLVESWRNGHTWYRKYSDGWIEQGGALHSTASAGTGTKTVSFPLPFTNNNYTLVSRAAMSNSGSSASYRNPYSKTATGFTYNADTEHRGSYYACGY